MTAEVLKLTTYFGERDRTPRGLLADELLDVYQHSGVAFSILMRGSEGFGRLHHARTDRLLSLSADLPLVSMAVDRPETIEAALERVLAIKRRGLVTLERARLHTSPPGAGEPGRAHGEEAKLSVYVGRQQRVGRTPAHVAICELLHRRGMAGATVLLGVDGTRGGRRTRARFVGRNAEVPTAIVAVARAELIDGVLAELRELLDQPLMTLERVRVCKRDGVHLASPHELPAHDDQGRALWQKLSVHSSQAATSNGRPLNLELIRRLRRSSALGATSLRGIWGFHGTRAPHGDRFLQIRRHVPVVTIVIDAPERIAESFAIIDELTAEHGLVTSEMVPAMSALSETHRHGELRLAHHAI